MFISRANNMRNKTHKNNLANQYTLGMDRELTNIDAMVNMLMIYKLPQAKSFQDIKDDESEVTFAEAEGAKAISSSWVLHGGAHRKQKIMAI